MPILKHDASDNAFLAGSNKLKLDTIYEQTNTLMNQTPNILMTQTPIDNEN